MFQSESDIHSCKATPELLNILHAFNAITQRIAGYEENLEQLLQSILDFKLSLTKVSYAAILLLDEGQNHLETVSAYGECPFTPNFKALLNIRKLLEYSKLGGEKINFSDLIHHSAWDRLQKEEKLCLGDMLCFPFAIQGKTVGVACVYREGLSLGIVDAEEFSLWAKLASLAIEKYQLYNQIHKRLEITQVDLKRSQSQLIRSEKLRSLVEIAMSVAHTIRNPVTVIGGLSRRLCRYLPKDDPKHLWSDMIVSEASRLENIVKEFERFFSINKISFQSEDLNELIKEALDDFSNQYKDKTNMILRHLPSSEPLICNIDPDLVKRAIIHLLSNAREASGNGANITVTTSRTDKDAIIDVADLGKGLSTEEADHVFDPFYTTKGQGAGMGLTFVHFVISEHSGQVELKSEVGVGSRFRIRLPLETPIRRNHG